MRIRVRVTAPVEKLRYARRTSRFHIRTGAKPEIALGRFFLKREIWIWHRDGVVHRLNGGANSKAPVQPVNNAGQAIQIFNLPYRRFVIGRTLLAGDILQVKNVKNLRYSIARRSRNQILLVLLLVLVLDRSIADYENEDERFARPATIWTDTDRLQVCAKARPAR